MRLPTMRAQQSLTRDRHSAWRGRAEPHAVAGALGPSGGDGEEPAYQVRSCLRALEWPAWLESARHCYLSVNGPGINETRSFGPSGSGPEQLATGTCSQVRRDDGKPWSEAQARALLRSWDERKHGLYSPVGNNCCSAVIDILKKNGAEVPDNVKSCNFGLN